MTRSLSHALACAAGVVTLASPSHAARPQAPETVDKTLSPYFWVQGGDASLDALPLKATKAEVAISGVIADVTVTQVYRNTGTKALEAVYLFPGSTRAAVHGLRMKVGERVLEAQIQSRDQARQTYEQAKQQGRTTSLLEQQRPNVFQMNVANILPGDEVKVELRYTELLVPKEGTYAFVYPTVVGPRYAGRPGTDSATGEAWVANPYTRAGEAPKATLDLEVKLAAGMPIARTACETHKTSIRYEGAGEVRVKLEPSEAGGANRDFILQYQLAGAQVQSGLLLHKGKDENFFLLMAQPPKRVAPADMPPREFVFVMDVSGSQMGFPLEISKTLMKEMIQGLRPQDRFNVMVFEGSSALWSPQSQPATPEATQAALAFVRQQNGGGGTELGAALRRALTLPGTEGFSRTFVVSTDGYISADGQVFDLIRQNLGKANLFAFGIGSSVNRHLIEGMAHAGQGEPFVLTRPDQAAAEAERFRAYISTPVLSGVTLKATGFQIYDVEPGALPDVLAERPVICIGKWRGEASGTLAVSGTTGHGPWRQAFDVARAAAHADHPGLRQLWARERIRTLSEYQQLGASDERVKALTALGLTYSLLTAHTSFVAVDTVVRNAGGEGTRVVQPLPLPQGVPDAAVGGASGSVAYLAPGVQTFAAPAPLQRTRLAAAEALADQEVRKAQKAERPAPWRLQALSVSSGSLEETTLRKELQAKLRATDLSGLPDGITLTVDLDAQGRIQRLTFDRSFPKEGELRARILTWRFPAGAGRFQVALHRGA